MRALILIGACVAALGGYIGGGGFTYQAEKSTVDLGLFKASVTERRVIPKWVGAVIVVAGLGMVWFGSRR